MTIWTYTLLSVFFVSLVSFMGILSLSFGARFLSKILLILVSFAVGGLLGDVFIHLLPETFEKHGAGLQASLLVIAGVLLFFVLEKFIRWRHCHADSAEHAHPIALMNLIGDGIHNLIDGMLIGASYLVSIPIGVATTVAVVLHEIPSEFGDFGVLLHCGFSVRKALFFNFLSALAAILGGVLSLVIGSHIGGYAGVLLPITAGGFIYIAGSDLIPELHRELRAEVSVQQFIAIILGVGVMLGLTFLE